MSAVLITDARPVTDPRKVWRVLQFPVTRIVMATFPIVALAIVLQLTVQSFGVTADSLSGALLMLAASVATGAMYCGYVRLIERRRVVELGIKHTSGELGRGFALGLGLFTVTVLVLMLGGYGTIERGDGLTALLPALCLSASAGIGEEVLFRGVLFRIVEERLGSWIALVLSATVFGLLHILNPGASLASAMAVAIEAGVLLGAAYMYSRRLWLPIALHTGWNFAQLGIFGIQGAGQPTHGILSTRFSGSTVLTGGDYGPDLSLVAMIICFTTAVILLVLASRRGQIVRPFWADKKHAWVRL